MDQPVVSEKKTDESSEAAKTEVPDDTLKCISDISQSASYAYVLYLSFLAYCTITILATTDSHIIRNDTTVLPLVNLNVPFSIFFKAGPLIAIGLFIYFEMYHNRMTGMLNDARSNYAPVDKRKLYPWLVTLGEQPDPCFVGWLERQVVTFSLWWTLPIVLWLFAFWTLRRHALTDCIFLSAVNVLGVVLVFSFWRRYRPSASFGRYLVLSVAIVAQAVLLGLLIFVILKGYPGASYVMAASESSSWIGAVKSYTAVDFRYTDFSDVHSLHGIHLEGAQLESAGFKGLDLGSASMQNANLHLANLDDTDLTSAVLDGADLGETQLAGSNISSATLVGAWMVRANLNHAMAVAVDFRDANLAGADLEGANLQHAENLTIEQLGLVCTLYQAQIDDQLASSLKIQYPKLLAKPTRNAQGNCESAPS
jgi:uncharacterized protein YjbI with pentapeptide repeats